MMEPQSANDYDDRGARAVYSVLLEIGQVLGAYRDRFVVIGGSVPWLLFPQAQPPHIGTLDVDLSLDAEALGDGEYKVSIRQFDGGPQALAQACRPLLGDPVALQGYQCIAEKFAREGGFGPVTVREFMTESAALGDMTTDQVELDAFRQVRAWLDYLGL